jgi:indolepyruvate ferredoxin oxidoreductase alpha subunit
VPGRFKKEPTRWTATPRLRHRLHVELNQKLKEIEAAFDLDPLNRVQGPAGPARLGVIASGVAFAVALEALAQMGVEIPVLKLGTPYPLPRARVERFQADMEMVLVLEEPDACIELQIADRTRVRGRLDGTVPGAGELSPEIIYSLLLGLLNEFGTRPAAAAFPKPNLEVDSLPLPVRQPRLCPGCGHRSAFFAMKREFGPQAIYPSDIGCYTLGMNLRAVDTFLDMGSGITLADGLYKASRITGDTRPILATIGDSTFLHSGLPPLINAVHTGARFVLVILDNHTTAMTGFQPTAASPRAGADLNARRVSLAELARACGASFVEISSPYEHDAFRSLLRRAYDHSQAPDGGVAVVIADWPCILDDPTPIRENPVVVDITAECDGCRYCVEAFECPALVLQSDGSRVDIERSICVDCGQCIDACYKGFIVPRIPEPSVPAA